MKYIMKPLFKERMQALLPNKEDFEAYEKIIHIPPENFIRANTLKISPENLLIKLKNKWKVIQPYKSNPEIILVTENLIPGGLGNALEHLLGYYYIQEVSSMLPPIALEPKPGELVLDLCASPGSKTSQMAMYMQNRGTIIANDFKLDRIKILASNLEKNGATNTIITRNDAVSLCSRLSSSTLPKFDKILVDAPCSGEGTLRSSPKTFITWNPKVIKKFSRQQKKFVASTLKLLKKGGTLVYSTCTHAPEENEEVVSFLLENFPVKIEPLNLPLKTRPGITSWKEKSYHNDVKHSCRVYPQDNNSEGFFIAKFTLLEELTTK